MPLSLSLRFSPFTTAQRVPTLVVCSTERTKPGVRSAGAFQDRVPTAVAQQPRGIHMFSKQPSLSQRTKSTYRQLQQSTAKSQGPGLRLVIVVVSFCVLVGANAGEALLLLSVAGSLYRGGYTTACTAGAAATPTRRSGASLKGLGHGMGHDDAAPLAPPVLELITPDGCASASVSEMSCLVANIQRAVAGGVSLVQLRDYKSGPKSKTDLAVRISAAIEGRAMFVVNGEPDAARASGADGVHLPERMMDRLVGLRGEGEWPRIVGCSVHSVAAAVEAARLGADYVQVRSPGLFV